MTLDLIKAGIGLMAIIWVLLLVIRAHRESQTEVNARRQRMLVVLAALWFVVGCDRLEQPAEPDDARPQPREHEPQLHFLPIGPNGQLIPLYY